MDWTTVIEKIREFIETHDTLQNQYTAFWTANVLFSWRWWLKVAMMILPWIFWLLVRKKNSSDRLLYAAFFIMAVSIYLDELGANLGLWFYPSNIQPFVPGNTAYNISMLPVGTMLFIQWFPKVKPVYKALVFAAIGAFVSEPLMVWLGMYRNVSWQYWYSFPILFTEYWIAHRLALRRKFDPVAKS